MTNGSLTAVVAGLLLASASPALALSCGVPPTWEDVVAADGSLVSDGAGAPVIAVHVHEVIASAVPLSPLTSRRNATRLVGVWGDRAAEPYGSLPAEVEGAWIDVLPEACSRAPRHGDLVVMLVHDRHPLGVGHAYVSRAVGVESRDSPSGVSLGIDPSRYESIAAVLDSQLGPVDALPPPTTRELLVANLAVWWPHGGLVAAVLVATLLLGRRRALRQLRRDGPDEGAAPGLGLGIR